MQSKVAKILAKCPMRFPVFVRPNGIWSEACLAPTIWYVASWVRFAGQNAEGLAPRGSLEHLGPWVGNEAVAIGPRQRLGIENGRLIDDVALRQDVAHRIGIVGAERARRRERHGAPHVIEQRRGVGSGCQRPSACACTTACTCGSGKNRLGRVCHVASPLQPKILAAVERDFGIVPQVAC